MQISSRAAFDDLNIKLQIGNLTINVLYIRFLPADPERYNKYHCHSSYELHFIPFGYGSLLAEGKSYRIAPGTFFLTGPQIYHEQRAFPHDPMGECCINFEIHVSKMNKRRQPEDLPQDEISHIVRTLLSTSFWFGQDEYDSIGLFEKIKLELDRQLVGYYLSIRNYVAQIIVNAVRSYSTNKQADYGLPRRNLNEMREQRLSQFFNTKNAPLTLEMIANDLGLSKRQASRIINQYYHTTFKRKHTDDRIHQAKTLLLTTDLSVKDISGKVGFSSASYFCSTFKQLEGMTPTMFRTDNRA
jgi:AraC-like DNA-binding protein